MGAHPKFFATSHEGLLVGEPGIVTESSSSPADPRFTAFPPLVVLQPQSSRTVDDETVEYYWPFFLPDGRELSLSPEKVNGR